MSGNIIQLNEDLIKNNLKDLVRNSVEETLNALLDHEADELVRAGKYELEMYLAGVSVRRVEDITELFWGTKVSSGTISHLNQKAYKHIEEWRQRPLTGNIRMFTSTAFTSSAAGVARFKMSPF